MFEHDLMMVTRGKDAIVVQGLCSEYLKTAQQSQLLPAAVVPTYLPCGPSRCASNTAVVPFKTL